MGILFLANIGNSDLVVEAAARGDLPREARRLAARLEAGREVYWPHIRLPILTKALDYVLDQGEPLEAMVLFVSDQDRQLAGEEEWAKDTCDLGKLVKEKLLEQYRAQNWSPKQVRLHSIPGNPADYDTMLAYYEGELPRVRGHYDPETLQAYLSLTGGTPAMNAMMLVVGNEVFGPGTVNLYDARERKRPFPLGVGRRLACRALLVALRANLETHQYAAALALVAKEGRLLVDSSDCRKVLAALLTYARDRLAFNFADAVQALDAALPYVPGRHKDQLLFWQNQVVEPTQTDRLRELYFSAEIKRQNHAYAGWLERVFRFQESALRHAAVSHQVEFRDARLEYIDQGWVAGQPGLRSYLAQAPTPGGGVGLDPRRPASRPLMRALLAYLAERDEDERLPRLLALSDQLEGLASMRNGWVHRSQGVRLADVEAAFGGDVGDAAKALAEMFALLSADELGANPYDAVNQVCLELVEAT